MIIVGAILVIIGIIALVFKKIPLLKRKKEDIKDIKKYTQIVGIEFIVFGVALMVVNYFQFSSTLTIIILVAIVVAFTILQVMNDAV